MTNKKVWVHIALAICLVLVGTFAASLATGPYKDSSYFWVLFCLMLVCYLMAMANALIVFKS